MTGFLTTHVLDTGKGIPAQGLKIDLFRLGANEREYLKSLITNDDGRTDEQILPNDEFELGSYELIFHAGDYLKAQGSVTDENIFINLVPIHFTMSEISHYHVPLLLSPFGYSTYRGS